MRSLFYRTLYKVFPMLRADAVSAAGGQQDHLLVEPWYVDRVVAEPDRPGLVRIEGWALPDTDPRSGGSGRFSVNGEAPINIVYPSPRPDLQQHFWQRHNAQFSGFSLLARAEYPGGMMEVRCIDSRTEPLGRGRESWFFPQPSTAIEVPDAERRYRVIGNRDLSGFLWLGATDAMRLKLAYEIATHRPLFGSNLSVLDWGVGCGRVARHLAPGIGAGFHGCDIDADNVAWCAENLPGRFAPSKLEPPLPYADGTFDLIYGVSVFTHLRQPWEQRWLAELRRVLKPGGVVMVTVHGQTAIDFAGLTPADYRALQNRVAQEGLAMTSTNNQLDGFVDHPDEYVNVFHSPDYIQREWSRFFTDIRLIPGYIFTHDLVVMTTSAKA